MLYRLGEEIDLLDIIKRKWAYYPLVKVPEDEVVDFEGLDKMIKWYEKIRCGKDTLHEDFMLKIMMMFGKQVVVEDMKKLESSYFVFNLVYDVIKNWLMFYYKCCEMLSYYLVIKANLNFLKNTMEKFDFYVKDSCDDTYLIKKESTDTTVSFVLEKVEKDLSDLFDG